MNQDGLLLLDKPGGMTSHDVVARCRRFFGRRDIGHAGTLDPMATGLLVILVGKATKLSDYILNGDKAYETTVLLGQKTDTDDVTGEVTSRNENFEVSLSQVEEAVSELSGSLQLKVPLYSAVKVKGKRLYEKARKGENFEPPVRTMEFRKLKLLGFEDSRVRVQFECSKGSFVRAWGKALGEKLGCGGTIETLRRIHSQPYSVENSIGLSDLEALGTEDVFTHASWIPLSQTLPHWPALKIEGLDEKLILNGQISRKLERFLELEFAGRQGILGVKLLSRRSNQLISLLSFEPPLGFKIRRVFPAYQNEPS